jgi:transposase
MIYLSGLYQNPSGGPADITEGIRQSGSMALRAVVGLAAWAKRF